MTSGGLLQPYPLCDSVTPSLGAFILLLKTNKKEPENKTTRHLGKHQEMMTMSNKSRDVHSLEVRDEKISQCKELLKHKKF